MSPRLNQVMIPLYQWLYRAVFWIVKLLKKLDPKVAKGFELRAPVEGQYPWLRIPAQSRPIWIHCASGEFEYALPLIRDWKKRDPQVKILVTYFTPSYVARIQKEPLVDYVSPSPWDTSEILGAFLDHVQPRALLFSRTDLWFEMTRQCALRSIPVVVFSMTFNKILNSWTEWIYRWRFQYFDRFFVVSEEDRQRLSRVVPADRITVAGDTRYEQCLFRLQHHLPTKIDDTPWIKKVFLAGSTWPNDETVLTALISRHRHACHWIVVPHEVHPSHISELQRTLGTRQIRSQLYSQIESWNGEDVLIVDQVGLLAHLYLKAQVAFVGGSFKKQVHSVMEALACGCLTFVGPHYQNNREAVEFSQMKDEFTMAPVQAINVESWDEKLATALLQWNEADREHLRQKIIQRAHVTEFLRGEIIKLLK